MYRIFKLSNLETYDTSSIKALTFNGVKLPPEMIKFLMRVAKNGVVEQTYGNSYFIKILLIDLEKFGETLKNAKVRILIFTF